MLGWIPLVHPDKINENQVRAVIEVKISPEREGGFDRLAQRISKFDEVEACHLMSGSYDLLLSSRVTIFIRLRVSFPKDLPLSMEYFLLLRIFFAILQRAWTSFVQRGR